MKHIEFKMKQIFKILKFCMIVATVPAVFAHMNINDVARTSRSRARSISSEREDDQGPVNRKKKHREQFYAAL